MGDVLRFPAKTWAAWDAVRTDAPVDQVEVDIAFPRGLTKLAEPAPAEGYPDGARVEDTVTGLRGTVRGRFWGGAGIEIGRPLKYAVEWDHPRMIEAVVACRLVPAPPDLAAASPRHVTELIGRRLRRIAWPPRCPDTDPPPPPRAA